MRSNNAFNDLERYGLRFVASPRHADVLLVTGPVTKNMREALERTWRATPNPKWVVAVGDCGADGGVFAGSYAVVGGVSTVDPGGPGDPRLPADAEAVAGRTAVLAAGLIGRERQGSKAAVAGERKLCRTEKRETWTRHFGRTRRQSCP